MTNSRTQLFRKSMGGFTLVELLVVALLVALMGGLTFRTSMRSYKRSLIQKSAKELFLATKYARLIAVEKQTECGLVLDDEQRTYYLKIKESEPDTETEEEVVINNHYTRPGTLGDDVEFEQVSIGTFGISERIESEGTSIVTFRPNGSADSAVVQIGDGDNHYTVYVDAATGRARVEFGEAVESQLSVIDLDMEGYGVRNQ